MAEEKYQLCVRKLLISFSNFTYLVLKELPHLIASFRGKDVEISGNPGTIKKSLFLFRQKKFGMQFFWRF